MLIRSVLGILLLNSIAIVWGVAVTLFSWYRKSRSFLLSTLVVVSAVLTLCKLPEAVAQPKPAKKKPVIKVATAHFPPFRIFENNQLTGADTEIVIEVFRRMGYETAIEVAPFKRVYTMGSNGDVAAIFTMTKNPERESKFLFSDPVSSVTDVFFKHKDSKLEWKSFKDLKGLTVGMSLGYSYPEPFLNAVDANIFKSDIVASAEPEIIHLRKLQQKRIDLAICEISVCSWILSKNPSELAQIVHMKQPIANTRTFHLGFSRARPDAENLRKKFNRELAKYIAQGKRRAVFKKYNMPE